LFIVSVCDSESCLFLSKFWGVLADSELFLVLANPLFSAPEIKHRFEITREGRGTPLPACGPGETHGLQYFSTSHNRESCSLSNRNDVFISSFVICWLSAPLNPPSTYFSINKTLEITILKLDTTLPKSWEIH